MYSLFKIFLNIDNLFLMLWTQKEIKISLNLKLTYLLIAQSYSQ